MFGFIFVGLLQHPSNGLLQAWFGNGGSFNCFFLWFLDCCRFFSWGLGFLYLTLSPMGRGGGSLRPPLAEIRIAPKRMHTPI